VATPNQIRSATLAQPFHPFQVKLADGRAFHVRHPEFVALSENGRELVLHDDEGTHLLYMPLVAEVLITAQAETE